MLSVGKPPVIPMTCTAFIHNLKMNIMRFKERQASMKSIFRELLFEVLLHARKNTLFFNALPFLLHYIKIKTGL